MLYGNTLLVVNYPSIYAEPQNSELSRRDTAVGTFVVFSARIHIVLLLKLGSISRQNVMAEIRITHGVLCKLERTICRFIINYIFKVGTYINSYRIKS